MNKYTQIYKTEITNMMLVENIILYLKYMSQPHDISIEALTSKYLRAKISIKLLYSQSLEEIHTEIGTKTAALFEYIDVNLTASQTKITKANLQKQIEILQNLKFVIKN